MKRRSCGAGERVCHVCAIVRRRTTVKTVHVAAVVHALSTAWAGAEPGAPMPLPDIALPAPRMEGGKPLMAALKDRQSTRAFSTKPLPLQVVSDLLWAACGINRADSDKRTAPSARNWR